VAYAATLLLAAVSAAQGARMVRPAFRAVLRAVPRVRSYRGAPVFGIAWPMLVQLVAVPLAMQSDRLVLSHRTTSSVLAEYNLASQMFTPIWAVVTAGGLTLWPVFARARSRGEGATPFPVAWAFGAGSAAMSLAVGLAAPLLAEVASGGRIRIGVGTLVAFGALMTLQGLKYPLGMYLTDVRGLRYQAVMIAVMSPVNLGLSWVLAGPLGAAGPVVGSAVGVGLFEVAANAHFVRRRLRGDPRAAAVPAVAAA
jgi:O-antigen/teichoic acid export membrane protein